MLAEVIIAGFFASPPVSIFCLRSLSTGLLSCHRVVHWTSGAGAQA